MSGVERSLIQSFCFGTIVFGLILVSGCQTAKTSRYTQAQDSAPTFASNVIPAVKPVPKYEPYHQFTLRPYEVFGKRYYPLSTGKGYEKQGVASWYGQKFHGHLTSNGETYNMFAYTAAHKTLPLPSYLKVTNLENNRQVIVRVNDRGPFHDNRIVDLSYAAAIQLGYQNKGTANVKIEVIHFDQDNNVTVGNQATQSYNEYSGIIDTPTEATSPQNTEPKPGFYVQVAALSDKKRAESIGHVLSALYQVNAQITTVANVHKLRLGPLTDKTISELLLEELRENGYPQAYSIQQSEN